MTPQRVVRPEAPSSATSRRGRTIATPDLIQCLTERTARAINEAGDDAGGLTYAASASIRALQSVVREQQEIVARELELRIDFIEVAKSEQELRAQAQADDRLHAREVRMEQQREVRGWILTVAPFAWAALLAIQWVVLQALGIDVKPAPHLPLWPP